MGYKPGNFAGKTFAEFIAALRVCLNSKGTTYYNKISGAVKCSNLELTKLELIIYLLENNYDLESEHSLDCIFTGEDFPGFTFDQWDLNPEDAITGTETYLQDFLNYAEKFCRTCIVTVDPAAAAPAEADKYLIAEGGGNILLEDNTTKIEL
jgi:hypothetical protein